MTRPIELHFKSVKTGLVNVIDTFTSYNFDQSLLTPASAFRFTAPGVDKLLRQQIRSGDWAYLYGYNSTGKRIQLATGFIDETDTHVTPGNIEYVLTGRDALSQLVDNDSVDAQNKIQNTQKATLQQIAEFVIKGTRLAQTVEVQQVPNGSFLFQTNPGETKATALQRYLEMTNCFIWATPDGRLKIGKPNFSQGSSGKLTLSSKSLDNNALEARVRRNTNQAVRQIITQLQGLDQVNAEPFTYVNGLSDVRNLPSVGRSIFRFFSYGSGNEPTNIIASTGNSGSPFSIGKELSLREIARENSKVLDIEIVVQGHIDSNGGIYGVDKLYDVTIEDDSVDERMYCYSCSYELTLNFGMITRMRLCKLGTLGSTASAI